MPEPTSLPGSGASQTPSDLPQSAPSNDPTQDHAPRTKREIPTRTNTNVRNLVWAIGLNLIIVAVLAVVVVGLGDNTRNATQKRTESINISDTAARAKEIVDFPVAAPTPNGWTVRDAKIDTHTPHTWRVRYTSPDGVLTTLVQQAEYSPALITAIGGTVRTAEPVTIAGATCEWLEVESSGSAGGKNETGIHAGVACQGRHSGVVVYGSESRDSVRTLAESALKSEGENR